MYKRQDPTLRKMMIRSYEILKNHPLNQARIAAGKNPANCFWFWGAGTKPILSSFEEKTGKKGVMISAVDLLKGIAVGAGMKNIIVEGADGTLNTNYEGKAQAAVDALTKDGYDFAYVPVSYTHLWTSCPFFGDFPCIKRQGPGQYFTVPALGVIYNS